MYHEPVLRNTAVDYLISNPAGIYLDGTLGGGGHAESILAALDPDGRYVGLDLDAEAVFHARRRLKPYETRVSLLQANFAEFDRVLQDLGITKISGLLLDLGVSSHQLDTPGRGFAFSSEGPLDMRMGKEEARSASQVIREASEQELDQMFKNYGEERRHRQVARAIVTARNKKAILTTGDLVGIVSPCLAPEHRNKSLARIFQALRIAVNGELENLELALCKTIGWLATGGRIVIIAYHSLEDRLVKNFFRDEASRCECPPELPVCICQKKDRLKILTKKAVKPSMDETSRNSRSRSAKLRAAERTANG